MQAQAAKPQEVRGLKGKKHILISFSARYNSRPEPSDCADPAEGRHGVHRISEVFRKFMKKVDSQAKLVNFSETCCRREISSPVSGLPKHTCPC
jgi:Fe-S cluster assembly ATPase SufC